MTLPALSAATTGTHRTTSLAASQATANGSRKMRMKTVTITSVKMYPCDRGYGDGIGRGYHHYQLGCCVYCGRKADSGPVVYRATLTTTGASSLSRMSPGGYR